MDGALIDPIMDDCFYYRWRITSCSGQLSHAAAGQRQTFLKWNYDELQNGLAKSLWALK